MTGSRPTLHYFEDDAAAALALAETLSVLSAPIAVHRFPDGETLPRVRAPAQTAIVYRGLERPDAKLFPLALAADALRRGGARRIVLVAPYLPYMRQDAVFAPGEPVSQSVLANFLKASFDRVVTVDAHLHRTKSLGHLLAPAEGDDLASTPALAAWIRATAVRTDLIVGPDEESAPWVRAIAEALGSAWLTMRKVRHGDTAVEIVLGDAAAVSGRRVLLVDDICSSGGTLRQAVRVLRNAGASDVVAYVTHALFGADVATALKLEGASVVISSDSIPHASNAVSLRGVLAAALQRELIGR
ncbi:MAG: ribose-phosphate diphosphokinase [Bauldia sp.]|nr:ribose-phosphate diphosphokinase [Bauldia sp.]